MTTRDEVADYIEHNNCDGLELEYNSGQIRVVISREKKKDFK